MTRKLPFLITGASGDLGTNLIRYIETKKHPYQVILHNENSLRTLQRELDKALSPETIHFSTSYQERALKDIFSTCGVCVHLAGCVCLDNLQKTYCEMLRVNTLASIYLIRKFERLNSNVRFVFASTQRIHLLVENKQVSHWASNVLNLIHKSVENQTSEDELLNAILDQIPIPEGTYPYELSKYLVEQYLINSQLNNFIILRISSVYGPRTHTGKMIQKLIEARLNGKAIHIEKTAEKFSRRNFIYIDDAIRIMYQAAVMDLNHRYLDIASEDFLSSEDIFTLIVKNTPNSFGIITFEGEKFKELYQQNQNEILLGKLLLLISKGKTKFSVGDLTFRQSEDYKNFCDKLKRYGCKVEIDFHLMDKESICSLLNSIDLNSTPELIRSFQQMPYYQEMRTVIMHARGMSQNAYCLFVLWNLFAEYMQGPFTSFEEGIASQVEDVLERKHRHEHTGK